MFNRNIFIYILIYVCLTGCDNNLLDSNVCENYNIDMSAPSLNLDVNGYYHFNFQNQTESNMEYTVLETNTGSMENIQSVMFISNKEIFMGNQWINLVNESSYTDGHGIAKSVLGIWPDFIGDTIKVYSGYTDNCDLHYVDSLNVIVNY